MDLALLFSSFANRLNGRKITQQRMLYEALRDAILEGLLPAATRLPATRVLANELRIARRAVDVLGDLVERVFESRIRHRDPGKHLGAEDARAQPTESTKRAEPVAGAPRRVHRRAPVGLDAQLVRREAVGLAGSREGNGPRRALLEEGVQLRHRLTSREAADVDPGDLRSGGQLVPRAGERESDEDRDQEHDAGDAGDRPRECQRATTPTCSW